MSSEQPDEEGFEERLDSMYQRYRQQHLEDKLEELATTMEDTLLQQEIAETFFGERIEIDHEIKDSVEKTVEKLENGEYDEVEKRLNELSKEINQAEVHVRNRIQQLRIERQDTATAMRRLNDRVERVDSAQLQALEILLEDWNWKQEIRAESNDSFGDRREAAAQYGENMKFVFDTLKEDLFGVYDGSELQPLVDRLLDDDRLQLSKLSTEEQRQLADSDLADYIELKLS